MVKITDTDFIEEKNKQENTPIRLYKIFDYDGGGNDLRYAEHDSNLTFDSELYIKYPISCNPISQNTSGQINKINLSIGNVDRVIGTLLNTYDFRDKKIGIRLIFLELITNVDASFSEIFYIDEYTVSQESVLISCTTKLDLMNIVLPFRSYGRHYCSWKFKSSECGYAGAESSCNKTYDQCVTYNNYKRFGGFPAIPTSRIFL